MAKARFVKVTGATKELDQGLIDRARQLAGLKGYVTSLPVATMDGQGVIDAYHDLYQVERSFRMAKSDPRVAADLPPRPQRDRGAPDLCSLPWPSHASCRPRPERPRNRSSTHLATPTLKCDSMQQRPSEDSGTRAPLGPSLPHFTIVATTFNKRQRKP